MFQSKLNINFRMHFCSISDYSQVGKALQPSIIFIGDCEKLFKKKLKPEEKQV